MAEIQVTRRDKHTFIKRVVTEMEGTPKMPRKYVIQWIELNDEEIPAVLAALGGGWR